MGHAHAVNQKIENPGTLKASGTLSGVFAVSIVIGLIAFFVTYAGSPNHAWTSFLKSHFFFMQIAMGAMFFIVIQWITTSMWSAPVRRLAESFTAYIPFVLLSSVLLFMGAHHLFLWLRPEEFKGDAVIETKLGYLNLSFFVIRTLISVLGWIWFSKKLVGGSLSVDQGADNKTVYEGNRKTGVAFLIFFAISFSMAAFDQLMSLDPHFFSTMFAVYIFAGSYQSFFAALAIITILMKRAGYLKQVVNENHLHDISKLMFAFTVFWAYTGFSQFMLIWYANLPEETGYFLLRLNEGWYCYSWALFIVKFVVPFGLLLPRTCKRNTAVVFFVSCWVLASQYMDLNWMVQPVFHAEGPHFGFAEVGVWLGFFGVFGLMVMAFLKKHNVVAIKDPYLADSVFHHHQ